MAAGVAQVSPGGAGDAQEVEAAMLEKALVLRGENGVHEKRGEIVVADGAALLARAVEEIGDELRLDLGVIEGVAAAERADGANGFAVELHVQRIAADEVREFGGANVDRVALYGVLPEGIFIGFRAIPSALQIAGEVFRPDGLANGNVPGSGKDLRGVLQDMAREASIDHAGIFCVVVREEARGGQKNREEHSE